MGQLFLLFNQLVLSCSESNLLGVLQTRAPLRLGCRVLEVVVVIAEVVRVHTVVQVATRHRCGGKTSIYAGLVESQRVLRCEHTDVGKYRGIILGVAVAVGRHIHDK